MVTTPIVVKRKYKTQPKKKVTRVKLKINSRPARLYNDDKMPYVKDKFKKYRFSNFNAKKINVYVSELAKQGLKKRFRHRKPKPLGKKRLTKEEKENLAKGLLPSQATGTTHFPASDLRPISYADQSPLRTADEQTKVILYHAPRVIPTREEVEATQLARQLSEMQINKLRVENDLKAEELKQLPGLTAAKIQKLLMAPVPDVVNVAANPVVTANPVVNIPPQDNKMMEQLMERLLQQGGPPPFNPNNTLLSSTVEDKSDNSGPNTPRPSAAAAPSAAALSPPDPDQILTIKFHLGVARNARLHPDLQIKYGEAMDILKAKYSEDQLKAINHIVNKKDKEYTDMIKHIIVTKMPWYATQKITKISHEPNVRLYWGSGQRSDEGAAGESRRVNKELYDDEIQKEMKKYRAFVGVVMRDELKDLLKRAYIEDWEKFGFIMNTQSTKEGDGEHWVAMYFDIYIKKFIAYFDPFGDPPHADVERDLKYYTDKMRLPYLLKYKVNSNKLQGVNSNLCGHHAMNFLKAMFKGEDFASATGWTCRISTKDYEENALDDEKKFREKHGFVKDTPKKGGYVPDIGMSRFPNGPDIGMSRGPDLSFGYI